MDLNETNKSSKSISYLKPAPLVAAEYNFSRARRRFNNFDPKLYAKRKVNGIKHTMRYSPRFRKAANGIGAVALATSLAVPIGLHVTGNGCRNEHGHYGDAIFPSENCSLASGVLMGGSILGLIPGVSLVAIASMNESTRPDRKRRPSLRVSLI